jgi:hypothetical protein
MPRLKSSSRTSFVVLSEGIIASVESVEDWNPLFVIGEISFGSHAPIKSSARTCFQLSNFLRSLRPSPPLPVYSRTLAGVVVPIVSLVQFPVKAILPAFWTGLPVK